MRFFSFDRACQTYFSSSIAQDYFANKLLTCIKENFGENLGRIGELGCGSGELYSKFLDYKIKYQDYKGCDISQGMIECFKERFQTANLVCQDFDEFLQKQKGFDLICSSSSLQWSKDFEKTLQNISQKCQNIALSFLTHSTFASLHHFLGTYSPLLSIWEAKELLEKYFQGQFIISYIRLEFRNNAETLAHLKKSGVLGGGVLKYPQAKKLLEYEGGLEYENMIFIGGNK